MTEPSVTSVLLGFACYIGLSVVFCIFWVWLRGGTDFEERD